MNYFDNVHDTLIRANKKSKSQHDHNAWGNKKGKNCKQYLPRGKVFRRLEQINITAWWKATKDEVDGHIKYFNEVLKINDTENGSRNLKSFTKQN